LLIKKALSKVIAHEEFCRMLKKDCRPGVSFADVNETRDIHPEYGIQPFHRFWSLKMDIVECFKGCHRPEQFRAILKMLYLLRIVLWKINLVKM
jgi:hypothetical protein